MKALFKRIKDWIDGENISPKLVEIRRGERPLLWPHHRLVRVFCGYLVRYFEGKRVTPEKFIEEAKKAASILLCTDKDFYKKHLMNDPEVLYLIKEDSRMLNVIISLPIVAYAVFPPKKALKAKKKWQSEPLLYPWYNGSPFDEPPKQYFIEMIEDYLKVEGTE